MSKMYGRVLRMSQITTQEITTQEEADQHLGLYFVCGSCQKKKFVKSLEGIAAKTKSQQKVLICQNCYWFGGQNNPNSQWIDGKHHIKPKNTWFEIIRSCSLMEGWMYDGFLFGFCVDEFNKIIPNSGIEGICKIVRKGKEVWI